MTNTYSFKLQQSDITTRQGPVLLTFEDYKRVAEGKILTFFGLLDADEVIYSIDVKTGPYNVQIAEVKATYAPKSVNSVTGGRSIPVPAH